MCSTAHAFCMRRVISSISNLNRWSTSPRLFCHIPSKRTKWDWDWRFRLNDTPYATGCTCVCIYHLSWKANDMQTHEQHMLCMTNGFKSYENTCTTHEWQIICRHMNGIWSVWQMVQMICRQMVSDQMHQNALHMNDTSYGVAMISRLLKITGLFCERAL